jgi:hypothetical protein
MRKQWRCFHCDEVFTSFRCASIHFGASEAATPACKLKSYEVHLVEHIRALEDQLQAYRVEDGHILRSIYSLEADHRQALVKAEQAGYDKGVADMRKEAAIVKAA